MAMGFARPAWSLAVICLALPGTPGPATAQGPAPAGAREEPRRAPELDAETREILAWQIALESWGFSPGLLDGRPGRKTQLAIAAAQAAQGRPPTGQVDPASRRALGVDPERALAFYRLTEADAAQIEDLPRDWNERARRRRLTYPSLADLLAERFHTSRRFLERLNPGMPLESLRAGDELAVPATCAFQNRRDASVRRIEIDLERRMLILLDQDRSGGLILVGILHCSIAADPAKAPPGECRIASIAVNPNYTFDPAKWPEVKDVARRLLIPPGPRNPVGVRWIGLDREGVGIHGTPEPENIGKTGSHGCFRLTNWDAAWLADTAARPGTPVRILAAAAGTSWPWGIPVE